MRGLSNKSEACVLSSPAIDKDGTIYIGDSDHVDGCFYAINPDGTEKWKYEHDDWTYSSPAIAENGIIYFGCNDGKLYAFYPNGTLKWTLKLTLGKSMRSPTMGIDGTIYIGSSDHKFYAIYPNGTIKWKYKTNFNIYSSPAIDDNGIIYIGSHDTYLYAFYPNGTVKWKFKAKEEIKSAPAIGDDGTIYVGSWDQNLYALYPNGTLRWIFEAADAIETSPTIGYNEDIYVGSYNGKLYSISPNGTMNWKYGAGSGGADGWIVSSPIVDRNGVIYVCSLDGNVAALNPDGSVVWRLVTNRNIEPSPAIGEDGTFYYASDAWGEHPRLYALEFIDNQPPSQPIIDGESNGNPNQEYWYTLSSSDPDGNDVYYYINWGDDSNAGWFGPYPSGVEITVNHTWTRMGTYQMRVKSKDIYDSESDWSSLSVIMPKYKLFNHPLLEFLFEWYQWFIEVIDIDVT
jgi:outer membrane protein assembly factor BamB